MRGKIRNEWIDAYINDGKMPEEVPSHLVDDVIKAAEHRNAVKVEAKKESKFDLSVR
jgi:polyhydroxyalkanoate synthesis regulator phasin